MASMLHSALHIMSSKKASQSTSIHAIPFLFVSRALQVAVPEGPPVSTHLL